MAAPRTRTLSTAPGNPSGPGTEPDRPTLCIGPDCRPPGTLRLDVRVQDLCASTVPVAVVGRYLNTPAEGAMSGFDERLGGWLQKGIDHGIISSLLGELAFIPVPKVAKRIGCELLIVGGMGEYGRFTREDLGYLMCNVALSVGLLGHPGFAAVLVGTGSQGMPAGRSARAIVEGTLAAFDHLAAAPGRGKKPVRMAVTLCVRTPDVEALVRSEIDHMIREMKLERGKAADTITVAPRRPSRRPAARGPEAGRGDGRPTPNRVTITRTAYSREVPPGAPPTVALEYAALTASAVVPVREQAVQAYFFDRLPERLRTTTRVADQERLGELLTGYLIPTDLHPLIHGDETLTLVLDPATAAVPWEMASYRRLGAHRFYGTRLNLTRQFRTVQTVAPGVPPLLNDHVDVLIIADPAGGPRALAGARAEARAVLTALARAGGPTGARTVRAWVRVGPPGTPVQKLNEVVAGLPKGLVADVAPCEPLDILGLLLNEPFDVVHFAGHGVFDPAAGRMGWVFDGDCLLTATEVLKVCRVPRLVFANACHSAEVTTAPDPDAMVGLAEAFFAQGIENYLGTGWPVADELATTFAAAFYEAALGRDGRPPRTLAEAAARARAAVLAASPVENGTWGAYQYYGQPAATLVRAGGS